MPWGLERFQTAGDLHFVTFSCYRRLPYLSSAVARDVFLDSLESHRRRYACAVYGYVVMPEHVHLLMGEPAAFPLSTAIRAMKITVSKRLAERPFWLTRYYDFNVYSDEKRIEKLKYMHWNPVARGLVACPEDWRWSSFGCYTGEEVGVVEITKMSPGQPG